MGPPLFIQLRVPEPEDDVDGGAGHRAEDDEDDGGADGPLPEAIEEADPASHTVDPNAETLPLGAPAAGGNPQSEIRNPKSYLATAVADGLAHLME